MKPITYIDTHALAVTLWKMKATFPEGLAVQVLSPTDLGHKDWTGVRLTVNKVVAALTTVQDGKPAITGVSIEKLSPGAVRPWELANQPDMTFRLPVITNPNCIDYYPPLGGHLPVGQLTFVPDGLNAAVNTGDTARYHLIVNVERPKPVETVQ